MPKKESSNYISRRFTLSRNYSIQVNYCVLLGLKLRSKVDLELKARDNKIPETKCQSARLGTCVPEMRVVQGSL